MLYFISSYQKFDHAHHKEKRLEIEAFWTWHLKII